MTRRPSDIITAMLDLLALFEGKCEDKSTLKKLIELATSRERRAEAHALFAEIRHKTLLAEKRGDEFALTQYAFEEICAKTLFNLTHPTAPFDPDSAFWVLPLAIQLGRRLGISDPGDVSPLLKGS
jgi:hypothetical protein